MQNSIKFLIKLPELNSGTNETSICLNDLPGIWISRPFVTCEKCLPGKCPPKRVPAKLCLLRLNWLNKLSDMMVRFTQSGNYIRFSLLLHSFEIDMAEFMHKIVEINDEASPELSVEERNLLSVAYKNVIGARRSSWRIISAIESKEEANDRVKNIKACRAQVEKELKAMADEILLLLEKTLIPRAQNADSKVFYYKM